MSLKHPFRTASIYNANLLRTPGERGKCDKIAPPHCHTMSHQLQELCQFLAESAE